MTNRANIRHLFLHPRPSYPLPAAAKLLGMKSRELRRWVETGEVEGERTGGGIVIPWGELASFALEWWSQEVVEEALGAEVAGVIPELLRLAELEVRIPRMEVLALERVAARDRKSVDAVLARELLDFVSEQAEWLSREVAGFAEAFAWPEAAFVAPRAPDLGG
jgi:hypothetical protein